MSTGKNAQEKVFRFFYTKTFMQFAFLTICRGFILGYIWTETKLFLLKMLLSLDSTVIVLRTKHILILTL